MRLAVDLFEEKLDGAFGAVAAELGGRGEWAVDRVEGDLGDGGGAVVAGVVALEVEAGDLEAVEQEAGAAGLEGA